MGEADRHGSCDLRGEHGLATPTDATFWLVQKLNNLSLWGYVDHAHLGNAIACIVMFAIVILLNMCRGFLPGL